MKERHGAGRCFPAPCALLGFVCFLFSQQFPFLAVVLLFGDEAFLHHLSVPAEFVGDFFCFLGFFGRLCFGVLGGVVCAFLLVLFQEAEQAVKGLRDLLFHGPGGVFLRLGLLGLGDVGVVIRKVAYDAGVLFAYFTNRKYVFQSRDPKMLLEFLKFVGSRVTTLLSDMFIMWLMVSVLGINDWIATLTSAVVVTVLNYVFSKVLVFRRNGE